MQIEILQSPWLYELMAFHINLRDSNTDKVNASALLEGCSLVFNDAKPSLCIELVDLVKLDIDLTCSICLVSLKPSSDHYVTSVMKYFYYPFLVHISGGVH